MAAAIVDNYAKDLLKSIEATKMESIWELQEKLDEVRRRVRHVREVLLSAEKKQTSSLMVRGWLEKLGDELLKADDLLDEIRYWKNAHASEGCCNNLVGRMHLLFSSADSLYGVKPMIKICQNLEDIEGEKQRIVGIGETNVVKQTCLQMPRGFVGRDDDRKSILKLLDVSSTLSLAKIPYIQTSNIISVIALVGVHAQRYFPNTSWACLSNLLGFKEFSTRMIMSTIEGDTLGRVSQSSTKVTTPSSDPVTSTDNISVIAVVGLLGIGKTTLVQSVCKDDDTEHHFSRTLWACVSGLLKFDEILSRILKSENTENDTSVPPLHQRDQLLKQIHDKRYLLVLDDLCIIDERVWNSLRALLDMGASGSKILITTRYKHVAKAVTCRENIFKLKALSKDDGWLMFKWIAHPASKEQEQTGKDIVRRCENIPMIIRVAANIVAQKTNWQQFREKDMVDIFTRHKNRDLLNELRPSYDQLNPHLKHCVAYCSLFPRDYEFSKQTLIQLWMAQGFMKIEDSNSSLEDIGEKQFQLLYRMSFFTVKKDALGNIVRCRMRKMFHHLAQNEAGTRCIMASGNTKFDNRTLHVSAKFNGSFPDALLTARKLRSLLCHKKSECGVNLSKQICQMIILKLKRLRTLNLSDCGIDVLPDNVSDLIQLRFLDLSKNYSLVAIPESMTKLSNLQVLNLNLCQQLKWLPRSMGRLAMLRCLEIDECDSLTYMPLGLQKLTSLQSLNRFVVSLPSEANKDSGGIIILKDLNNLRGRLKIELSGQWTELVHNAPSANLKRKGKLTELMIEWRLGASDNTRSCHYYETFLEGLYPPEKLEVLCIEGYQGRDFPSWAKMGMLPRTLPHLVIVSIEGCKECKLIPPFGHLDYLIYLTLRNMEAVQHMVDEAYDPESSPTQASMYKSLEELTLHSFYSLKGWWKEGRVTEKHGLPSFPKLSKLKIWNCPKLTSMPLFNEVVEVDFQDVNQKLLEMSSMKVEPSECTSSNASKVHETLSGFSYDKSSKALSYGLLEKLTKLKTLNIKSCPQMQSFPIVWDKCIQILVIDKCYGLRSVANGLRHLQSLDTLEISHCDKL
ncbi:hypothetical protein vseg_003333 [Gypsophila vaccaria]